MGTVKYSGPVASFHCPTEATIRSLKVHFSPKQNLNGQTNPWPGGGNKNLLNMDLFTAHNTYISSTGATGNMSYYSYTECMELAPNTYTLSGVNNTVSANLRIHTYDENQQWVKQLTSKYIAAGATFSCTFTVTSEDKYIRISAPAHTPEDPLLQLEVGSTATAYVPYANICPIQGWDGVVAHNDDGIVVPEEYQKVEYLESTGTQYIYTNIPIQSPFTIDADFQYTSGQGDQCLICAGYNVDNRNVRVGALGYYGGNLQNYYAGYWYPGTISSNIRYKMNVYLSEGSQITIRNGIEINRNNRQHNSADIPLDKTKGNFGIFCMYRNGAPVYFCYAKLYSMKLWGETGAQVGNFIPCRRKSDNKPGMYDTVSGEFFTNQGTGEFICGPDVGQTYPVEFPVVGKNITPWVLPDGMTVAKNYNGNNAWHNGWIPPTSANGKQVTYSADIDNTNGQGEGYLHIWTIDANGSYVDTTIISTTRIAAGSSGRIDKTITINTDRYKTIIFGLTLTAGATASHPMVEYGSSSTAYEPYNSNNTVYGGWVDLVSGEVQEDGIGGYPYCSIVLDGTEEWTLVKQDNEASIFKYYYGISAKTESNSICSHFKMILPSYTNLSCHNGFVHGVSGNLFIQPINSIASTVEEFQAYLASQYQNGTPVTVLFQANKAPNTYYIAPTALQTFLGQNNVWSNADYVEIEYDLHETQTILERKAFILANQAKIKTASGAPATFTTTTHAPLKMAKVNFLPHQTGSGTPSPTNVRPILGWKQAGLVINRGVNLLNEATLVPNTGINADGGNTTWNTTKTNDFLYLPPGSYILTGTYTGSDASANLRVHGYNPERNWVKQITYQSKGPNQSYSIKFTMTADMPYMRFSANKDVTNIQIEAGSTATTYEPFSGRELSVSWGNDNGVIYGGYVDLVSGELVQEWKLVNLGSFNWAKRNSGVFYSDVFTDKGVSNQGLFCSNYSYNYIYYIDQTVDKTINDSYQTRNKCVNIYDSTYANYTVAEFRAAMSGVMCAYKLADPIVHQLTPSQIKDFLGSNTVSPYSNSTVEVQYWTH